MQARPVVDATLVGNGVEEREQNVVVLGGRGIGALGRLWRESRGEESPLLCVACLGLFRERNNNQKVRRY